MGQAIVREGSELTVTDTEMLLDQLLHLGRVISLVGAGGKTTLLYALAQHSAGQGLRTLVTTTTHIVHPGEAHFCTSLSQCQVQWSRDSYAVWAADLHNGKLGALKAADFSLALAAADRVLIEADGARRLPCKAPADHEPVIPQETEVVVGVLGLSALGKRLDQVCLRSEEAARLLGCGPEHLLTPEDLVTLLSSPQGQRKHVGNRYYFAVLNQADLLNDRETADKLLQMLRDRQIPAALTSFTDSKICFL